MGFVRTISGDIGPENLGFTLSHEHIYCIPPYWAKRGVDDLLLDDAHKSEMDIIEVKNAGCKTIIDATCVDYGRDLKTVKGISDSTNMQVVATTGFNKSFLWDAFIPGSNTTFMEYVEQASIDALAKTMIREVEIGDENYGIRCGQIKYGTGYNSITPLEVKTLRAACRAHLDTRAPLHSHTENGTMALQQMNYLKEEEVDISNVSFGHMDRNPDPWMHLKIAEQGAYLCFDGIGKVKYAPESVRIACILNLVKHGYKKQVLISGDTARKSYFSSYSYGPGYKDIIINWVPRFIEEAEAAGFNGRELVNDFFIYNPRECFSFKV